MFDEIDWRRVRRADVPTCQATRDEHTPRLILDMLAWHPDGLTDDEIVTRLSLAALGSGERLPNGPTIKAARSRLKKANLVEATGERRKSRLGQPMQVWHLTGSYQPNRSSSGPIAATLTAIES